MTAEDQARAALRESMRINGDVRKGRDVDTRDDGMRLPRVKIDLSIPVWGLATGGVVVVWGLVSMYFTLQDVSGKVSDLQATVRASNTATIQLASDQALLKYRVEKLESTGHAPK